MKRLFDFFSALIAIIILLPIILMIAVLIKVKLGSPVIFKQERPGLHRVPFYIFKFRTMTDAKDETGQLLPDSDRLTNFGNFLRRTSMDELPQLFNVICGELSLVGPRPLLMEYLPLYSIEQARRHEVKPGITGWAQVNGRNDISWEEKFSLDVWYVDNWSFYLDLKILVLTIFKVYKRYGITKQGHVTMEKFRGTGI